ncbi:hypothetical protein cand_006050 [Cryptosporidium andersoni]|uniref:Phosphatidylinositol-glycan biosynthesis class X protein n=1 Tax=Cryptosporidium andersoni TaxID=117008 RepID=A0A1J4MQ66_9CRYT|nr:hypothetical protein cand_006050 [Cryptosporidium andersoni]
MNSSTFYFFILYTLLLIYIHQISAYINNGNRVHNKVSYVGNKIIYETTFEGKHELLFTLLNNIHSEVLNGYSVYISCPNIASIKTLHLPRGLYIFLFFKLGKINSKVANEILSGVLLKFYNFRYIFNFSSSREFQTLASLDISGFNTNLVKQINRYSLKDNIFWFIPNIKPFHINNSSLQYIYLPLISECSDINFYLKSNTVNIPIVDSRFASVQWITYVDQISQEWKTNTTWTTFGTKINTDLISGYSQGSFCNFKKLRVIRTLYGKGLHRNLETEVELIDSPLIEDKILVLDIFPKEYFINLYEILDSLRNTNTSCNLIYPYHRVDTEISSEKSGAIIITSFCKKSLLPIHLRYQSPCKGCSYKEATFFNPTVALFKYNPSDNKLLHCIVPEYSYSFILNGTFKFQDEASVIKLNIPVGNTMHLNYVYFSTTFMILLTSVISVISIKRYKLEFSS